MTSFSAHLPATLAEAVAQLQADDEAKLIAGGHSLIPVMKQGLSAPSALIDLSRIPGLSGVSPVDGGLRIGAMTRHAAVGADAVVDQTIPVLGSLARGIGDPHVRHRGTIGGSVATNDPNADYPAAVLALDGVVETTARRIEAADYFCGMYTTALEPDEIITAVEFRRPDWAAYAKAKHPASGFAMVGVLVARFGGEVRVAVTGAGADGVFRASAIEAALEQAFEPGQIVAGMIDADDMASDFHADQAYRAQLVTVLCKRCVSAFPA